MTHSGHRRSNARAFYVTPTTPIDCIFQSVVSPKQFRSDRKGGRAEDSKLSCYVGLRGKFGFGTLASDPEWLELDYLRILPS